MRGVSLTLDIMSDRLTVDFVTPATEVDTATAVVLVFFERPFLCDILLIINISI